jgi:hypothetical protein
VVTQGSGAATSTFPSVLPVHVNDITDKSDRLFGVFGVDLRALERGDARI